MNVLIIVVVALLAVGAGFWWSRRNSESVGDDLFKPENTGQKIQHLMAEKRSLRMGFVAVAALNVVLLGSTGLITVTDHIEAPSLWLLVAGVLFGALPAAALLGIGHSLPNLISKPSVPAHLVGDEPLEPVSDRRRSVLFAVAVGLVSLIGSALFALQHMMEATEYLGFTAPIFGVSPAVLIPACIEFFQGFLLASIVVKEIDLENLKQQAAGIRSSELEFDISQQQLETDLASRRLSAEADHAEAKARAGARQRQIEQETAIESAKRDAAASSLVETAERQAAADLKLEDAEREALNGIKKAEIATRVAEAQGECKIREAQIVHLLEAKQVEAEAESMKLRAMAELSRRQAEAEGQIQAVKAEAGTKRMLAAAELEIVGVEAETELERQKAAAELERRKARFAMELEAENKRLEIEFRIEQLQLDHKLAQEQHKMVAIQASLDEAPPKELSLIGGRQNGHASAGTRGKP